uniref:Centrosomal protein 89 n=1 Tax=Oryzias sinensis TaxID=183150 RepID=A0A8C7Y052_9TELE
CGEKKSFTMLKLNFRRRENKEEHIAHGLIPAASVAPKPAVPRTPPPHNPNPSPERPRSALAAAILSSSLTGQTWAIPPFRPRSSSEIDRSESIVSGPNFNTAALRDRWSEDLADRPRLSSPEHSDEEFIDKEEEEDEEDEDHVYQSLDTRVNLMESENVPDVQLESQVRIFMWMSGHLHVRFSDPHRGRKFDTLKYDEKYFQLTWRILPLILQPLIYICFFYSVKKKISLSCSFSKAELQSLRRHAQELVDENDALKLTVHRLKVELSLHQGSARPPSKDEVRQNQRCSGCNFYVAFIHSGSHIWPKHNKREQQTKTAMIQKVTFCLLQEELKKLRLRVEELIRENQRLHAESARMSEHSQEDSQQIQQQALLVLQENQDLLNQIEALHVGAKANRSKHQSEVTKLSKQLMLLEAEKQSVEEELQESRREAEKREKEVQVLQKSLKDAVTWDEHCHMSEKLRRWKTFPCLSFPHYLLKYRKYISDFLLDSTPHFPSPTCLHSPLLAYSPPLKPNAGLCPNWRPASFNGCDLPGRRWSGPSANCLAGFDDSGLWIIPVVT